MPRRKTCLCDAAGAQNRTSFLMRPVPVDRQWSGRAAVYCACALQLEGYAHAQHAINAIHALYSESMEFFKMYFLFANCLRYHSIFSVLFRFSTCLNLHRSLMRRKYACSIYSFK